MDPDVRKRRPIARVRTGCSTCKIRKVKCDETKPACNRCTSTGRNCDGYAIVAVRSRPRHAPRAVVLNQENRSLEFFLNRVAPSLAGFLGDDGFWKHIAHHFTSNNAFVRNAISAVSFIFEQVEGEIGNPVPNISPSALQYYNKAISSLVEIPTVDGDLGMRGILITCILFICLELMRGDISAAQSHIRSGSLILTSWNQNVSHTDPVSSRSSSTLLTPSSSSSSTLNEGNANDLVSTFTRLRLQSALFDPSGIPLLPATPTTIMDISFSSLSDARKTLFSVLLSANKLFFSTNRSRYTSGITFADMCIQAHLQALVAQYRQSFKLLFSSLQHTWTERERDAAKVLLVQAIATGIQLGTCLSSDERAYDAYRAEYENIVAISADIIARNKDKLTFHFDMGLIPPLHFIGWKCRYPILRRQILAILGDKRWREGMFDSFRSYRFVHQIMLAEESSLSSAEVLEMDAVLSGVRRDLLPPESARIHIAELGPLEPHAVRQRLRLGLAPSENGQVIWNVWISTNCELPTVQPWLY